MANSVRVLVTIWNRQYELTAHQHSKALGSPEAISTVNRWKDTAAPPSELQQAGANRRGCARLADQCAL